MTCIYSDVCVFIPFYYSPLNIFLLKKMFSGL
jgi:hypothetical protein